MRAEWNLIRPDLWRARRGIRAGYRSSQPYPESTGSGDARYRRRRGRPRRRRRRTAPCSRWPPLVTPIGVHARCAPPCVPRRVSPSITQSAALRPSLRAAALHEIGRRLGLVYVVGGYDRVETPRQAIPLARSASSSWSLWLLLASAVATPRSAGRRSALACPRTYYSRALTNAEYPVRGRRAARLCRSSPLWPSSDTTSLSPPFPIPGKIFSRDVGGRAPRAHGARHRYVACWNR